MKMKILKDDSSFDEMDDFVRPDLSRIISNDSESNSVDISVSSMSGYWLDLDKECEPLDFLFAKQGDGVVERLLARGNIQLLKGQEKTGKSACGLMFITAALRSDEGFLEVRPQTPDLMNVLWVDTEQDESTLRAKGLKVCEMADIEHDDGRLHILPLRKHTVEKRLDLFSHALKEVGPDFVFWTVWLICAIISMILKKVRKSYPYCRIWRLRRAVQCYVSFMPTRPARKTHADIWGPSCSRSVRRFTRWIVKKMRCRPV